MGETQCLPAVRVWRIQYVCGAAQHGSRVSGLFHVGRIYYPILSV